MTSAIQADGALHERFRIAEPDGVSFFPTIEPIGIIALGRPNAPGRYFK
ncbi:hypothetical protein J6524_09935 [Bradyrhizobium sp. WSM 1738]|nr:hypothetical protein [Bradyrhizobium hereditatis]MCA6115217.1 hypothetical protein [Bradyrhizobium hereditatis]